MIRVALISTLGTGCGTSVHAERLVRHANDLSMLNQTQLNPDVTITTCETTLGEFALYNKFAGFDIVHVNESGFVLQGNITEAIQKIRAHGKKTLLTMCNPIPTNNRNPWTEQFDRVAVFEPHTTDGYEYVPIPAPVYKPYGKPREKYIGTNGFPQERKNLPSLAAACQQLGYNLFSFMPESQHANARDVAAKIMTLNPGARCWTHWVSDQEILDYLSICTAACYPYIEWMPGSSSAAMYAVSARTPVVVSRCTQFNTMFDYEDEVYFIESPRPTVDDIVAGLQKVIADGNNPKRPFTLYDRHNWDVVAARYIEIYKGMMS